MYRIARHADPDSSVEDVSPVTLGNYCKLFDCRLSILTPTIALALVTWYNGCFGQENNFRFDLPRG